MTALEILCRRAALVLIRGDYVLFVDIALSVRAFGRGL